MTEVEEYFSRIPRADLPVVEPDYIPLPGQTIVGYHIYERPRGCSQFFARPLFFGRPLVSRAVCPHSTMDIKYHCTIRTKKEKNLRVIK
jgi:hypothetical protein